MGRGAHSGCSASSFRCWRLLCRMPRSSLSALRARWNAAHRRPHGLSLLRPCRRPGPAECKHGRSAARGCARRQHLLQPASTAAGSAGRTEARQVEGHAEQAQQPDAERLAAARQQRIIDRVLLKAQDDLQGDLPAAPRRFSAGPCTKPSERKPSEHGPVKPWAPPGTCTPWTCRSRSRGPAAARPRSSAARCPRSAVQTPPRPWP